MKRLLLVALSFWLMCWPALSRAQNLAEAKRFTTELYMSYETGEPNYLGPSGQRVFSPRLWGLIRRDQKRTRVGDVGFLDNDPICDCQDSEGLTKVAVEIVGGGQGRSRATVRFLLSGEKLVTKLDLVIIKGRWRIDDIHSTSIESLATALQHGR